MTDAKMFISLLSKHSAGGQTVWLVGAECLDDSCKTVCRVRECDTLMNVGVVMMVMVMAVMMVSLSTSATRLTPLSPDTQTLHYGNF